MLEWTLDTNRTTATTSTNSLVLQDMVEKVIMLRKAVERERRQFCGLQTKVGGRMRVCMGGEGRMCEGR